MKSGKLTTTAIKGLKTKSARYFVADGAGLWLEIFPTGLKSWRVRYSLHGNAGKTSVGRWPEMSLQDARKRRDEIIAAAHAGISPTESQRKQREIEAHGVTVEAFGERYMIDIVNRARKSPDDVLRYFVRDIYPQIGAQNLACVRVDNLRDLIFAKRDKGHEQAALALRDVLKRFFDYAVVCGIVPSNPVYAIPRKYIATSHSRTRSLSADEVGVFINRLDKSDLRFTLKLALRQILLTLTRKTEILHARWLHVNMRRGEWTIPPEQSKNRKPHVVYLSKQAWRVFQIMASGYKGEKPPSNHFVFPSLCSYTQPMSKATLNRALARISGKMEHFTVHDLRRTAATLLSDDDYQADWIEKALNHTIKGVRGVYNRAQYREQRKKMLQDWADKVEDFAIEQRSTNPAR